MTDPSPKPLNVTDQQQVAVERIVRLISRFGLTTPAILFLESMRPLSFVGSQFMHVMSPAVTTLLPVAEWDHLAELLEDRRGMDYVISQIEAYQPSEGRS